jgi:hypothetical protein
MNTPVSSHPHPSDLDITNLVLPQVRALNNSEKPNIADWYMCYGSNE